MAWNYQREETHFDPLPEGKYRVRVRAVEKAQSSKGNDMLSFQFDVSGSSRTLYHYITFLPNNPSVTNGQLTQFFDSFADIKDGDFEILHWIGKVGACKIKHEVYNGEKRERISYFIKADKQDDIPPWKEPPASGNSQATSGTAFAPVHSEYDVPF